MPRPSANTQPEKPALPPVQRVQAIAPTAPARTTIKPIIVTAPLRAFLGITFFYAGIQKLTDPGFFRPHSITYIGTQLTLFAHHSPIGGFLISVAVPHAIFFGSLVAWGEVAIGLGTLVGGLFRPAAFFGVLLSLTLWLTASWTVRPYFYGADIFALFGWVTLLLAGTGGWLAIDTYIGIFVGRHLPKQWRTPAVMRALAWLELILNSAPVATQPQTRRGYTRRGSTTMGRRELLQAAVAGSGVSLFGVWLWRMFQGNRPASSSTTPVGTDVATSGAATAGATSGSAVIANVNNLPTNSAATFQIPSNGDPGVVIHLSGGNVVAYDTICTHNGCNVQYDPGSQLILCPCHGAVRSRAWSRGGAGTRTHTTGYRGHHCGPTNG